MARGERNARHDDRNPAHDPYFDLASYAPALGYAARSGTDYTGYTYQDGALPARLGELAIDPEVKAALGGELVGRLAASSYGNAEGPAPGSYVQGLPAYRLYGYGAEGAAPAGASSTRSRLGIPPPMKDDTSFAGVGADWVFSEQHAMGRAPLEMGAGSTNALTPEHVVSRIRRYANAGIYDGGDGLGYGSPRGGGGGDFGSTSASEELANIRRENDSGDEFSGDGWDGPPERREDSSGNVYAGYGPGNRPPTSFDRRRVKNTDYDR